MQKGKPIKDSAAKKAFKKNVLLTTSSDAIAPVDSDQIPRGSSNESLADSTSTVPQAPPNNQAPTTVFRRRSKKEGALEQSLASPSIIEALIHRLSRRRVVPWIGAGVTYNMLVIVIKSIRYFSSVKLITNHAATEAGKAL